MKSIFFFLCHFARAAWFGHPWYIKADNLFRNHSSILDIILMFISSQHPYASLNNIMTFLWFLWKARNDNLFQRKQGNPVQVYHAAQAILNCLSLENIVGNNKKDQNEIGKDELKKSASGNHSTSHQAKSNNQNLYRCSLEEPNDSRK